ncbi:MAG: BolA family protein [Gammaproteobacteria bacterium]
MQDADRTTRIAEALRQAFAPCEVTLTDESHLHRGHAGAAAGKGHYHVRVVSAAFAGKGQVARHRMVYAALAELLDTDIHALGIEAATADEAEAAR